MKIFLWKLLVRLLLLILPCGKFRDQRDVNPAEKKILQRCEALFLGRSLSCLKSVRIKLFDVVFLAKKPMTSSWLATMVDITVLTTQQEKSSILDFIGPRSTRMPTTLSPDVTFVNVKAKFL
ncbi:hypothetical protein Tco_0372704, partial [Tanacetum coccineum]